MPDPHEHPDQEAHATGGEGTHDAHGHEDHHAHDVESVGAAIVTISTTRTLEADPSGDALVEAFEREGHSVATRELIADEYDSIQGAIDSLSRRKDVDVIVSTGGTGVSPDDVTVEAVDPLFDKLLPGFGELFRRRSEAEIGTRIIATRAAGGLVDGVLVFCLPGSVDAVGIGAEIILAEVQHLVGLARRDVEPDE